MTLPNLQSFNFRLTLDSIFSYVEQSTTQAGGIFETPISLVANASNQLISIATLFPALTSALAIVLYDATTPVASGFSLAFQSGGSTPMSIRPGAFFASGCTGLPNLYVNNLSATLPINLTLFVAGQ